jgi:hypothetical protein
MKSDAKKQGDAAASDTASEGGKSQKNKTVLVVALLGCGGLLLVGCCAGGGIGGWYFIGRSPTLSKVEVTQAKGTETSKATPGGKKYKSLYDKIQLGMNNKQIEALIGSRGEHIVPADMPRLTDKTLNPLIGKGLRENEVNLLWRWKDAGADEELVIGYQTFDTGDIAVFKAYFYVANSQDLVEYKFDKSVVKK